MSIKCKYLSSQSELVLMPRQVLVDVGLQIGWHLQMLARFIVCHTDVVRLNKTLRSKPWVL